MGLLTKGIGLVLAGYSILFLMGKVITWNLPIDAWVTLLLGAVLLVVS